MHPTARFTLRPARTNRLVHTLLLATALLAARVPAAVAGPRMAPQDFPVVCAAPASVAAATQKAALDEARRAKRFDGERFVRTELYFGSERPDLPEVSPDEFKGFLDAVVTPCFPDGLTLLTGKGQFRESDGQIVQETSFVLILLYPEDARAESNTRIEAIRGVYKNVFQQESVLRVDDPRPVRVGF